MTILEKIALTKRDEVAALGPRRAALERQAAARSDYRDFDRALRQAPGIALIAEIKKASPSAGVIQPDFDPVRIGRAYEAAGAQALSILTDLHYFQGDLAYLQQVRAVVGLPVLRKDFLIDELQMFEAAAAGADAILLIVAMLPMDLLARLHQLAQQLGLSALVEVHDEAELKTAQAIGARLIGVNNRNLHTFTVDLATTERLSRQLNGTALLVAESGLHTRADVQRVRQAGAKAILVGESLMRSGDIAGQVRELLG